MESRERLRDLPVLMLQTALNGVGQALLIGDKVRSRIVRLVVGEEERSEKTEAPDTATRDEETSAEPAARREPVIFAPRPSKAERDGEKTAASAPAPAATPTATPAPAAAETEAVPAPEAKVQESLGTPKPETAPEAVTPETPATEAPATEVTAETAQVTEAPQPAEVTEAEKAVQTTEPAETAQDTEAATETATETPTTETAAETPTAEAAAAKPARTRRKTAAKTPQSATEEAAATPEATPAAQPTAQSAAQPAAETGTEPAAAETAVSEQAVSEGEGEQAEPLPGYANLTIASLRSRLRGKSAEQVHALLDYEKAHTNRPEVVRMFQNRLSKLQSES